MRKVRSTVNVFLLLPAGAECRAITDAGAKQESRRREEEEGEKGNEGDQTRGNRGARSKKQQGDAVLAHWEQGVWAWVAQEIGCDLMLVWRRGFVPGSS